MNQQMMMQELERWMGYVHYGQYKQFVQQQALQFLMTYPNFKPTVESMQLPGDPGPMNLLMFKGLVMVNVPHMAPPQQNFPIKIILVNGYPIKAPKVYIDMQLSSKIVQAKQYLGQSNEILIPYLQGWNLNNQPNIKDLMSFLQSVIQSDPPVQTIMPQGNPMYPQYQQQMPQNPQYTQHNPNMGMAPPQQFGMHPQQQMNQQQPNLNVPKAAEDPKKTKIIEKIDVIGSDMVMSAESTLNNLVDIKTHLRNTNNQLNASMSDVANAQSVQTTTLKNLQKQHENLQNQNGESGNFDVQSMTSDSIAALVTPQDQFSEKILSILAKYNALEDTISVIKKAFDNGVIPLDQYLKQVRALSNKQCKQMIKMEKLRQYLGQYN